MTQREASFKDLDFQEVNDQLRDVIHRLSEFDKKNLVKRFTGQLDKLVPEDFSVDPKSGNISLRVHLNAGLYLPHDLEIWRKQVPDISEGEWQKIFCLAEGLKRSRINGKDSLEVSLRGRRHINCDTTIGVPLEDTCLKDVKPVSLKLSYDMRNCSCNSDTILRDISRFKEAKDIFKKMGYKLAEDTDSKNVLIARASNPSVQRLRDLVHRIRDYMY